MKKFTIVIIIIVSLQLTVSSQSCLTEGITFSTQEQIDLFQSNHPNCTDLKGDVIISGSDIRNLNGLGMVTSITGDLWIYFNNSLNNLAGLDNVTSIGGDLWVWGNLNLTSLTGLDNLATVGGSLLIGAPAFWVMGNPSLTSLTGLEGLTSIGGSLGIEYNASLTSLTGLDNLTYIGENLFIHNNDALTSLTGLDNIELGSIINLYIFNNQNLSICAVQGVCEYLASSGKIIEIHDNASSCKNLTEVDSLCYYVTVGELTREVSIDVYPNPITTSAVIEFEIEKPIRVNLSIYNHLGQQVETLVNHHQPSGKHQAIWNAEGLPGGIYVYRLQSGEQQTSGKMVVLR